jgi:hypothetical protein
MRLNVKFDYLANHLNMDREILKSGNLYDNFVNECRIVSYQGVDDQLIKWTEKKPFCKNISFCEYHQINKKDVDGVVFGSASHGLDADFLKLFDAVMQHQEFDQSKDVVMSPAHFETLRYLYDFDYFSNMIILKRVSKNEV